MDATAILTASATGDTNATDQLLPLCYTELRDIAARKLDAEPVNHTLTPTALVHEVYLKLIDQKRVTASERSHFVSLAAQQMRRILVDHSRYRRALRRGGDAGRGSETGILLAATTDEEPIDLLDLDGALTELQASEPDVARIVELRFFGGMTIDELAAELELSAATVKRRLRYAQARVASLLRGDE